MNTQSNRILKFNLIALPKKADLVVRVSFGVLIAMLGALIMLLPKSDAFLSLVNQNTANPAFAVYVLNNLAVVARHLYLTSVVLLLGKVLIKDSKTKFTPIFYLVNLVFYLTFIFKIRHFMEFFNFTIKINIKIIDIKFVISKKLIYFCPIKIQRHIAGANIVNNMRITAEVKKIICENLAYASIDLGISPITLNENIRKRPYLMLKKPNLEVVKKYAETDNLDDIFEFESDEERELLLKKYKVL